ncbi:HD domain-containing phosphohydrolase [Marinicellulosiphila megalodicopiae]|uniref:HD domain-containing phosphohydrolase n=1 Tax=Marinicellulosiphila megalodicopiae TaxID=2724896 RepID=UPI003BB20B2C
MIKPFLKKGISLQAFVGASIIMCMLVLAVALVSISYVNNRNTLIEQVERTALIMTEAIDSGIVQITDPVIKMVQLLELDPLAASTDFESRLLRIKVLVRTLEMNKLLSAIYFGYDDGDFFLLRTVNSQALKDQYGLGPQAKFLLQAIDRQSDGKIQEVNWFVYDENLNIINKIQPEDYQYDPRLRPWFQSASSSTDTIITKPYIFFTTQEVGLTFAQRNINTGAIVGVDAALGDLSNVLKALQPSQHTQLALIDVQSNAIAYSDSSKLIQQDEQGNSHLAKITDLDVSVLTQLSEQTQTIAQLTKLEVNKSNWYGLSLAVGQNMSDWRLLFAVSESELFSEVNAHMIKQLTLSGVIILILISLSGIIAKQVSSPLLALAEQVTALSLFNFDTKIDVKSNVKEVQLLADLTSHMAAAIKNFQAISNKLAQAPNGEMTLDHIAQHLMAITSAKSGVVYLFHNDQSKMIKATSTDLIFPDSIDLKYENWKKIKSQLKNTIEINNEHLFVAPLIDHNEKMLGALILELPDHIVSKNISLDNFIQEIAGSAATAISTRNHIQAQQALLDSIVKLLADTIDAKSPYTSGHCERVPVLAELIVDAAIDSDAVDFEHFTMNKLQRHEFKTAAWLHDCGKITSPEYVVDKATKLETIYNRIHEIRTRFEVLWRDVEIEYLKGLNQNKDETTLLFKRAQQQQKLQKEFELLAKTNIGAEFTDEQTIEEIKQIGMQTWQRHFSKTIGLSYDEASRIKKADHLPATEYLIDDKPEQLIEWGARKPHVEKDDPKNIWGFDMELPKYEFNRGEIYNLCIQRGTLTNEERFIMNNHMVQTIKMLQSLPLPEELANVPNIAGNHHETMDGTGYPRKLKASELTIPERIMAVADIFEALTACDRPYKEAKNLTQSLSIMANMVKHNQIDASIFSLFVTTGTYKQYAEKYLSPSQIDEVNTTEILNIAGIH